ncbi:MAG: GtrA family protein, partial [Patescibacteria group bacterium]|nr:GtrA family protein [Patescibacteria group bacterium]
MKKETVKQAGKFGIVGVSNTLIDFGVFNLLTAVFGVYVVIANLFSVSIAIINS